MAASKKFYIDMHVHTSRYSACSALPAERLIAAARARRLNGLVLTEHNYCWEAEELDRLLENAGGSPFLLLSGCEVRVVRDDGFTGDLIVLGTRSPPAAGGQIDEVCRQVHAQGGVVIAPHPFGEGAGIGDEVYSARIDAIEMFNDRYRAPKVWRQAAEAWSQLGIAAVGGSDAHALEAVGRCSTEFDSPIATMEDLVQAIRERRCRGQAKSPPSGIVHSWLRGLGRDTASPEV